MTARRALRYAVIPTRDRPEHYERAVRAVRSQVDHLITVAHLGAPYALGRVIRYDEDPPNISTMWRLGLDRAALLADGEPHLVALLNDDARVSPAWFDLIESAMDREGTALGGGIRWRDRSKVAGYAFIVRGGTVQPSSSPEHRWLYSDDYMVDQARLYGGVSIVPEAKSVHGHKRGALGAEGVV